MKTIYEGRMGDGFMAEICGNCGKQYGYHHCGTSLWPLNYCPDPDCSMDWENGPGTVFKPTGKYVREKTIRDDTKETIDNYVKYRLPPGDFIWAVLSNNLTESFGRADEGNRASLFEIVQYLYNECPVDCWGSPEKVKAWLEREEQ